MKTSEKIWYVAIVVTLALLIGCAAPRQYSYTATASQSTTPAQQPVIQGGLVPVDIQNPVLLEQEVLIFWGGDPVNIVPDPRTGGWMYSRPAFKLLRVGAAYSENNWHNYARIMLPRNSSFILAGRTMNFWDKGSPYFVYFSTGPTPFTYQYTMVTPSYPPAVSGGLVTLQNQPIMPFGNGPLRIEYTIDLQALGISGRPIAREITNKIWGR